MFCVKSVPEILIIYISVCVISIRAVTLLWSPCQKTTLTAETRLVHRWFNVRQLLFKVPLNLSWRDSTGKENLLREIITRPLKAVCVCVCVCVCVIPHQLNEGVITSSPLLKRPVADMKARPNRQSVIRTDEWWQTKTRQKDCFSPHFPLLNWPWAPAVNHPENTHTHTHQHDGRWNIHQLKWIIEEGCGLRRWRRQEEMKGWREGSGVSGSLKSLEKSEIDSEGT